ncbi:hypothetical protein BJP07_00190 [Corynebacterium sp. NML130628]|nr:hypothetical protein BJP07_00190 [Corynebacterium sp. NML130628]
MRNASVKELLALRDKAKLLVVGDQARLCLDDQVARPTLRELDTCLRDPLPKTRAAGARGNNKPAEPRTLLGGKNASAALQISTVSREQVQRVRVRVTLVELPVGTVLLGNEDVDAEFEQLKRLE